MLFDWIRSALTIRSNLWIWTLRRQSVIREVETRIFAVHRCQFGVVPPELEVESSRTAMRPMLIVLRSSSAGSLPAAAQHSIASSCVSIVSIKGLSGWALRLDVRHSCPRSEPMLPADAESRQRERVAQLDDALRCAAGGTGSTGTGGGTA